MNVASFFASMGFKIDTASVNKVNKTIDHIEARLHKLGTLNRPIKLNLSGFAVDQGKLNIALGTALDIASERLVFHVSRFHIDQTALNRDVGLALTRASAGHRMSVNPALTGAVAGAAVARGSRGGLALSSVYAPAMALALGGYGLSRLNKLNQKVVAAELQSQAVVQQAGGTAEEGTDSFNWLRSTANRVGFNYLDATQGYNSMLAGLTHAGMTVKEGQGIFKGFSEHGRVMKIDAVHQKRLFYALSEVADMNELQKRQLNMIAIADPGAKSIFAEAWQRKIGGKLHGQEAEDALLKAIHARQVKGNILIPAGEIASERAAPNLAKAEKASQAEQGRYQNAIADLAKVASDAGVEEGFARIFRTLTAGLNESNGLVRDLAEYFNEATKYASELLLFPQSFMRALEGKDSLVADWLGKDTTKELIADWRDIKDLWKQISAIRLEDIFGDFLPTLKSTAKELADIVHAFAELQRLKSGDLPTKTIDITEVPKIKPFDGIGEYTDPKALVGAALNNTAVNLGKARERGRAVYDDPHSLFYHDPKAYDDAFSKENQKDMAMGMAAEQQAQGVTNTNTVDITIKIDPTTLASEDSSKLAKFVGDAVKDHIGDMFGQVQDKFPAK